MKFQFLPTIHNKLYIRDPYQTVLGKKIIVHSIILMYKIGFRGYTFKKLSAAIGTTEAGIYRYFKNKESLLMYIACWYWAWLEYQIIFETKNIKDPRSKLKKTIGLVSAIADAPSGREDINIPYLQQIVTEEGLIGCFSKINSQMNGNQFIQPYIDLCSTIENCILACHPVCRFPRFLATTLIETAHLQNFITSKVPLLSDFGQSKKQKNIAGYLEELVMGSLNP